MSSWRQLTGAVCVVCAVCALCPTASGRVLMLDYVGQRALCPLEVKMDVSENRIPRVIKTVRCAQQEGGTDAPASCCGINNLKHQCTEVQDRVLVHYGERTREILVPVGCVCLRVGAGEAAHTPSPDR